MSDLSTAEPAYTQLPVTTFLTQLASKEPIPGGGGVAALSGALSTALVSMVANLTLASKKYTNVADEVRPLLEQAEQLRADFTRLVEEDAHVFKQLSEAYKLPRETEEAQALRSASIQSASKQATQSPLRVLEQSRAALRLCQRLAELERVAAISDVGVATILAQAAMQGAILMVETNLSGITDSQFVEAARERVSHFTHGTEATTTETLQRIMVKIKG